MVPRQDLVLGVVDVDAVGIAQIHSVRARIAKLPKLVHGNACVLQHGLLPRRLNTSVIVWTWGTTVFFQHDRLARCSTHLVVLDDPGAAPGLVVAPAVGVEVESAVVECLDAQVLDEVDALGARVGVRAVADVVRGREPTLVAQRHHVPGVEALDVLRDFRRPIVDGRGWAAVAARLVGQLPGKDGGGALVPVHQELDIVAVDLLARGVGVPGRGVAAEGGGVGGDTTQIAPVVDKIEDELNVVLLSVSGMGQCWVCQRLYRMSRTQLRSRDEEFRLEPS